MPCTLFMRNVDGRMNGDLTASFELFIGQRCASVVCGDIDGM